MHKQADTLSHCAVSAVHQLEGRVGPPPQQQWLSRLPARSLPHTPCSRTPPQRSPPTCGCMFCGRLRVACVGDSLTRGDGLHEHPPKHRVPTSDMRRRNKKQFEIRQRGNYPALLARLLGPKADVRNFGHGGATACAGGNPPYGTVPEYGAALRFRPHVVLLMLGTNSDVVVMQECPALW